MSAFRENSERTIHLERVAAAEGCRKYLVAIIRDALKHDRTPPGLSAADTKRLAKELRVVREQQPYVRKQAGVSASSVRRREPTPLRGAAKVEFQAVADEHGLTVADITGPSRYANIIAARRDLVARLNGRYSLSLIGRWMGNRDHSTIISYLKRAS